MIPPPKLRQTSDPGMWASEFLHLHRGRRLDEDDVDHAVLTQWFAAALSKETER